MRRTAIPKRAFGATTRTLVFALLLLGPASAQEVAPAPIQAAHAAEDEALGLEARGRFPAAFRAYARAIDQVLVGLEQGALTAEPTRAPLDVWLRRIEFLAGRAGLHRAASELYRRVVDDPRVTPWTRDVARTHLARELRALSRPVEAEAQEKALGLVTAWFVAGPFDNERGTGFAGQAGPETGPFDPAATWPGKARSVGWRTTTVAAPPDGLLDLDALFRPDDQALAYALTYLHAEKETAVALRLGSDEAVRVWVDRREVHAFAGRRPLRADQDALGVTLRAGWNELLVEVADQTGPWALRLRVSAPEGGPAPGVRAATLAEIAAAPKLEPRAVSPAAVAVVLGGIADLEVAVKARPDDWRAWFHLGYLRWARQAHDRGDHPDLVALERACQLRPKDALLRPFLARASVLEAEHSVAREENARRLALEEAIALDPEHHEARRELALYYWGELSALDRARELIRPAVEAEPDFHLAQLLMAELEAGDGLEPLARARLLRQAKRAAEEVAAGATEQRPEELVDALLDDARERQDGAAALLLRAELAALDGRAAGNRMALADALWQVERSAEALAAADASVAAAPFVTGFQRRRAELLAAAGRLDDAAAALEGALAIAPEEPALVEALARLEERRGDPTRADELLARARALDPNDADLREYMEFRARHEAKLAPFEASWVLEPRPLLEAARPVPLDPRRTHRVLLRQTVVRLQPDGRTSEWSQVLLRVENEQGGRTLQQYGIGYHSDQRLTVQLGRVHRKGGETEDVPVGTWRDRSGGEFGRRLTGGVRFPPLEPGDAVEVRWRTDDLVQGFFGDYYGEVVGFQDDVAIDKVRWVLLAPPTRRLYFNTPRFDRIGGKAKQIAQPDGSVAHVYEAEKVPALDPEPNQPWTKELLPQVQVSTFSDWDAFARWYWGLVAPQHESDPAIRAKVAELTRDAATPEEKIRRIYEFVVSDVRYNAAWEFGVHGFKPYNATSIYQRRFGDCKDKSTLINVMLREVGIRSHPVLIYGEDVRGSEDFALPLIGHFNHCISWVEHGEGGLFLDGTAEHHPFKTLPSMDYGAKVVVITPERALVKDIPSPPSAENTVREQHRVKLEDDGRATLESTYEANGTFGVVLRSMLSTEGRRAEVLEPRWGQAYGGAHVSEVKCSDLKDLNTPVKVELKVELPRVLQGATGGRVEVQEVRSWMFEQVFLQGRKLSGLAADEARAQDLVLPIPGGVEETVVYELPPGHEVKSLPAPQEIKTPFGTYERRYEQRGRQLHAKRVLKLDARRIPASQYGEFRGWLGAVERAEAERPALVESEGGE